MSGGEFVSGGPQQPMHFCAPPDGHSKPGSIWRCECGKRWRYDLASWRHKTEPSFIWWRLAVPKPPRGKFAAFFLGPRSDDDRDSKRAS